MREKNIYFWACDFSNLSGEGILGRSFINYLKKKDKRLTFININKTSKYQKRTIKNSNNIVYSGFFHKYIYPLLGLLYLWIYYFRSKKVLYLNYLPLWNSIIYILLPPKTILGPITGTIMTRKISFILDIFEKISLYIIKARFESLFFSNNFFQLKYSLKNKNYKFNFLLNDFKKKKLKRKKYDFIIYFRNNSIKQSNYIYDLINLIKNNYNVTIIGDRVNLKGIRNLGYINRDKTKKIISNCKYAITNPENLYSYFFQDCMSYDLKIFFNAIFKKYNIIKSKRLVPIKYNNPNQDFNFIKKNLD